jgi:hypothetical protein
MWDTSCTGVYPQSSPTFRHQSLLLLLQARRWDSLMSVRIIRQTGMSAPKPHAPLGEEEERGRLMAKDSDLPIGHALTNQCIIEATLVFNQSLTFNRN